MRQTITDLINTMATELPDNTSQLITPAKMRLVLENYAQSIAPITSLIGGSPGAPVPMVLSTTPAKMPTGVFSSVVNGNPALWEARLVENDMICKTAVGRAFMQLNTTFTAAAGVDVAFTLARNGVPLIFRAVQAGRGAANPISVEFSWVFETLVVNDIFELFVASLTGTPTIQITNGAIKCLLLPQYV